MEENLLNVYSKIEITFYDRESIVCNNVCYSFANGFFYVHFQKELVINKSYMYNQNDIKEIKIEL